jgi:hypothetical protein
MGPAKPGVGAKLMNTCNCLQDATVSVAGLDLKLEWPVYGKLDIMLRRPDTGPEDFAEGPLEDITKAELNDISDVVYEGVVFAGQHAAQVTERVAAGPSS